MEPTKNTPATALVPAIIHWINLVGLVALGLLVLVAAVVRAYQLILLVPIALIGLFYWKFRSNPNVTAFFLTIPAGISLWVVLCENVASVDNLLGTEIARNLQLSMRLQSRLAESGVRRSQILQACCNDPLTYHYRPGSRYHRTYDCPTCYKPYEVLVDETGHLNRRPGFYQSRRQIDLFVAGDSVLQGWGMPSVVELVEQRLPLTVWNLSVGGYSPRNRVHALIAYAVPKRPKWLVLDFYSANDPSEAIEDEACESLRDFRCRFAVRELRRQLMAQRDYNEMLDVVPHEFGLFGEYTENNLTLAVTHHVAKSIKLAVKKGFVFSNERPVAPRKDNGLYSSADVSHPGQVSVRVRSGRLLEWTKAGMRATHGSYDRLVKTLATTGEPPAVILLYNPSAYEIYRGILVEPNREYDDIAAFQLEAQKSFATSNGWRFIDLTVSLRRRIKDSKQWIYGQYDAQHWSPNGTAVVADVLTAELSKILGAYRLSRQGSGA